MSGMANALYNNTIQNAGGANLTCTGMEKFLAVCKRDANQQYYCDTTRALDMGVTCTGDYPPYGYQVIASVQPTSQEVGPSGSMATWKPRKI